MVKEEQIEKAIAAFLVTVSSLLSKDVREVLEALEAKIEELRAMLLTTGWGWTMDPPRKIAALQATRMLYQQARLRVSIIHVSEPEVVLVPAVDGTTRSIQITARLRDDQNTEVDTLAVINESLASKIRRLAQDRCPVEVLGRMLPVPKFLDGRRYRLMFHIEDVRRVSNCLQLLDASRKEIARTESLAASLDAQEITPLDYIFESVTSRLGIEELINNMPHKFAIQFAILQSLSAGWAGHPTGRLHGLLVGPPAVGKELVHIVAQVCNPTFEEAYPSKVTVAGLCGAERMAKGGFRADPGLLSLADQGVLSIQDFHTVANDQRRGLYEAIAMLAQDGKIVDASAARTTHKATAALLLDLNRKSDLGLPNKDFLDDVGLPIKLLSRLDLLMAFPSDPMHQAHVGTYLIYLLAKGQMAGSLDKDAAWVREVQLLVAYLRDRVQPDLEHAYEDIVSTYLDLVCQNTLSESLVAYSLSDPLAAFYPQLANSALKLTLAVCRAWNRPVADQEIVQEAFRFLAPKIDLLRSFDPGIEVPKSWNAEDWWVWSVEEDEKRVASQEEKRMASRDDDDTCIS